MPKLVPMIHVPDVDATANWYASIGFRIVRTVSDDGEMNWALLEFGGAELMLSIGGSSSDAFRGEVDLYLHVDDVDAMFTALAGKVEVVEEPHDTLPGAILTERQRRLWLTDKYKAEIESRQALKRLLLPEDVARLVLFLAADDSSAITNQSYVVDGGWV